MIHPEAVAKAAYQMMLDGNKPKQIVDTVYTWIDEHNRLGMYPLVIEWLERIERSTREHNAVNVSSPYTLSDEVLSDIKKHLQASEDAPTKQHVDSSLLGGFVATYQSTRLDASLERRLQELKSKMIHL